MGNINYERAAATYAALLSEALDLFDCDPERHAHIEDDPDQLRWALAVRAALAAPGETLDMEAIRQEFHRRLYRYWHYGQDPPEGWRAPEGARWADAWPRQEDDLD